MNGERRIQRPESRIQNPESRSQRSEVRQPLHGFQLNTENLKLETPYLRLAAFLPRSLVNGPGVRAVVWVQGCARRCPGCFNPEFLPMDGGTLQAAEDVAGWILAAPGIEGVTFSGGEPFLQAAALACVARRLRAEGMGVVVFTGMEWEELRATRDPARRALLSCTDSLVAGPYLRDHPADHPILGSANQRLVHLSGRYRDEDFLSPSSASRPSARKSEFRIAPDGTLSLTGFPGEDLRAACRRPEARDRRSETKPVTNQPTDRIP